MPATSSSSSPRGAEPRCPRCGGPVRVVPDPMFRAGVSKDTHVLTCTACSTVLEVDEHGLTRGERVVRDDHGRPARPLLARLFCRR